MFPQPCLVGMDVAQATLDIAGRPTAETWQVANEDTGLTTLVTQWQTVVCPLVDRRQSQKSGVDSLYAQIVDHYECHGTRSEAVATATGAYRLTCKDPLTFKTVAHPR